MPTFLLFMGLCGLVGYAVASRKGEGVGGFLLGTFLGPIGLIVVLASKPNAKYIEDMRRKDGEVRCKFCAEFIRKEAVVCRHCNRDQNPVTPKALLPRPVGAPPGWQPDPYKRFESRWWNGQDWTGKVRTGQQERIESGW